MKQSKTLIFTLVLIICFMISACNPITSGSDLPPDDAESRLDPVSQIETEENLTAEEWVKSLPSRNFEGYEFKIAASTKALFIPEDEEGLISEAVSDRNKLVEEKYNIKIAADSVEANSFFSEIMIKINSNTMDYDLLSAPMQPLSQLAENDSLYNLYSLPFVDFNKGYINKTLLESSTVENTLYIMFDSLCQVNFKKWGVFYDIELLNELGLPDPYEIAKNGDWTWEVFLEYALAASAKESIAGYTTYSDNIEDVIWSSSGIKFFGDTNRKPLELRLGVDDDYARATQAVDMIKRIKSSKTESDFNQEDAIEAFSRGSILFFLHRVDLAAELADNSRDWGLLPMPKLTAEQEYCSWLDQSTEGIAVPSTAKDTERSGLILNALCAASFNHLDESIEKTFLYFYLRNNNSGLMLETIFENPMLDAAYIYGSGVKSIADSTYTLLKECIRYDYNLKDRFENIYVQNTIKKIADSMFK